MKFILMKWHLSYQLPPVNNALPACAIWLIHVALCYESFSHNKMKSNKRKKVNIQSVMDEFRFPQIWDHTLALDELFLFASILT